MPHHILLRKGVKQIHWKEGKKGTTKKCIKEKRRGRDLFKKQGEGDGADCAVVRRRH